MKDGVTETHTRRRGAARATGDCRRLDTDAVSATAAPTHALIVLLNHPHLRMAYGIAVAERALQELQWRMHLRGSSIAVIGEDCFLATLPEGEPPLGVIGGWLVTLSNQPIASAEGSVLPLISIGLVHLQGVGRHTPSTIDRLGPGSVQPPLPPQYSLQWRIDYERDMATAVVFFERMRAGACSLTLQPVVSRHSCETQLYSEALLRIRDTSTDTALPLMDVLGALRRTGLIRLLDHCVVHAAIERLAQDPSLQLGCNISAWSTVLDSWWSEAIDHLSRLPEVASRLTIELTEDVPLPDSRSALALVNRLHQLGCRVAIDDFGAGTGAGGLEFSIRARPDVIKIDRKFLQAAHRSGREQRAFAHLVGLCRTLADYVVMEGVEQPGDLVHLDAAGVDWFQGYLVDGLEKAPVPVPMRTPGRWDANLPSI